MSDQDPGRTAEVRPRPGEPAEGTYRLLFDANPQPMWVYALDTLAILDVNEAALRHYGYSRDEFLGLTLEDLRPPEELPRFREHFAPDGPRRTDPNLRTWGVWKHRKKDGTLIDVEVTSSPTTWPGRRGCLALVHDITAQKQAEDALRASEAEHRRIVETAREGIWMIDAGLRTTYVNGRMAEMLGYAAEEMLGRPPYDFVREADRPALARKLEHRRQGLNEQFDFPYRKKDGSVLWAIVSARAVLDAGGRFAGALGMFTDITERKRVEEALRESEERHRTLAALNSDYTYACRVEPDGRVVLESASEGFQTVTGYTVEEVEARGGWPSMVHPDDLPGALESARSQDRERTGYELRIITRSGQTRWLRVATRWVLDGPGGRATRLLGAAQDITERKQAQEKLQDYARKLQSLSRRLLEVQEQERRHLALELHDEIGQVLTGLRLTLDLGRQLPAEQARASLAEAQGLVRELTARVRDISLRLRPTMLDDLGLLPALLWQFERYTAQTQVRVEFEHHGLEGRLGPEVETAAYRIVQEALTNVARHAGVGAVSVRVWLDPDALTVQVEDGGSGFDAEAVLSGLRSSGLSGMQERAVLLGGRLTVESQPGAGTRLTAELPARDGPGFLAGGGP